MGWTNRPAESTQGTVQLKLESARAGARAFTLYFRPNNDRLWPILNHRLGTKHESRVEHSDSLMSISVVLLQCTESPDIEAAFMRGILRSMLKLLVTEALTRLFGPFFFALRAA